MDSPIETSLVDGSCGRRPSTTTSNSSTALVTMIVVHQTQIGTSMHFPPEGSGARGLARIGAGLRRSLPPVGRASGAGPPSAGWAVMTTPHRGNTPLLDHHPVRRQGWDQFTSHGSAGPRRTG